jgi:enoyl-CoA hydratase/carnithine racemase
LKTAARASEIGKGSAKEAFEVVLRKTVPVANLPSFDYLEASYDGRRATLTLNRPDRLNALSIEMMIEVVTAAHWFDQQPDLRVVVVSGTGRAFCAGFDIDTFTDAGDTSTQRGRDAADAGRIMADALESMAPIAIARLHGHVVGGGLVLASACDLRIASDDTTFSIPEADLGIPLAWGGIPRLVREIGPTKTKELVMTCRPFDSDEAAAIGFLNQMVPIEQLDTAIEEMAEAVASRPRVATLATKAQANAVTSQMVGISHTWSDTHGLAAAMRDPEAQESRANYQSRLRNKKVYKQ